jgi:4-amino-4-deoxy-L-arabinose transferase-like glycosyltransferase
MLNRLLSRPRTLLLAAVVVFLLQALAFFTSRWVEDESWYSIRAATFLREGKIRNATFATAADQVQLDASPPAMPLLLATSFKTLGCSVLSARLPSLLAGIGVVVIAFLLGRLVGGVAVGGIAAFFVAADTFGFLAARCVRPEAIITFFNVLALLLYLYARAPKRAWLAGTAGAAAGIAINIHPNGLATVAVIGLLVLFDCRLRFIREPRFWWFIIPVVVLVAPDLYLLATDAQIWAAFKSEYLTRAGAPLAEKLSGELGRYAEFIGLTGGRGGFSLPIPVRLHVALAFVGALGVLFRRQKTWFWVLLIAIIPHLLWWAYSVNKVSRYFAIATPLIGVTIAAGIVALQTHTRAFRIAAVVGALVVLSQLGGNAILIRRASSADYSEVSRELRGLIPKGQAVYGAITFWMALNDRPYWSYNRTQFGYMMEHLKAPYWILNDRVMMNGDGDGTTYDALRASANAYAYAHGTLVGKVKSPFYGDLDVFRLNY